MAAPGLSCSNYFFKSQILLQDGFFTIDLKSVKLQNGDVKIEVINLLGQIIISEKTKLVMGKLQHKIKLGDAVAEGMYLVKVTISDNVYTSQINLHR